MCSRKQQKLKQNSNTIHKYAIIYIEIVLELSRITSNYQELCSISWNYVEQSRITLEYVYIQTISILQVICCMQLYHMYVRGTWLVKIKGET